LTRSLSPIAAHEDWDWLPSYSPDGNRIVFNSYRTGHSDIYSYDRNTSKLSRLTTSDNYEAHARLSPGGESLLFNEQITKTDYRVNHLEIATGESRALADTPTEEGYASWSPSGDFIAFASDRHQESGADDLFVMTKDGEVIRQLTDAPHKDGYPYWSPDGRYIYFNSYRALEGVYRLRMNNEVDCERVEGQGPR